MIRCDAIKTKYGYKGRVTIIHDTGLKVWGMTTGIERTKKEDAILDAEKLSLQLRQGV